MNVSFAADLELVYLGDPWYGKSISALLQEVDPAKAFEKPFENAHSIAEVLAHMVAWRDVVIDRLDGKENAGHSPEEGFKVEATGSVDDTWREMLRRFHKQHELLLARFTAIEEKGEADPSRLRLLNGIIQHDIYHLGQIALLNK